MAACYRLATRTKIEFHFVSLLCRPAALGRSQTKLHATLFFLPSFSPSHNSSLKKTAIFCPRTITSKALAQSFNTCYKYGVHFAELFIFFG
jgi:hypothetical protein